MEKECCDRMAFDLNQDCDHCVDRFTCPDALVIKDKRGYGLIVHDGGQSAIGINFCPWCGASLVSD